MEGKEEDQPTCSKKTSRTSLEHDGRDKKGDKRDDGRRDEGRRDDGRREDDRSEYTASNSSVNSRLEMANRMSKSPLAKKELKISGHEAKKRMRTSGRVTKRGPPTRRQPKRACRRKYRSKPEKKRRAPSASTVFTRLSSRSSFVSVCKYCGYRTARRCSAMRRVRNRRITKRRKIKGKRSLSLKLVGTQQTATACLQAGSRSMMFSPLMVKENAPPLEEDEERECSEITPQMIHFSLRELMMWRHDVKITSIAEYLKNHYPVCQNTEGLLEELRVKLRIAAIVGMVIECAPNYWCLSSKLYKRKIHKNHVTMFWKLYGDTLKPVKKERVQQPDESADQTNTNNNNTII